jgi:hypothetical protein
MTLADFTAWAHRLGLGNLSEDDLRELRCGWLGLQPQLARIRENLRPEDRPPSPPLGA